MPASGALAKISEAELLAAREAIALLMVTHDAYALRYALDHSISRTRNEPMGAEVRTYYRKGNACMGEDPHVLYVDLVEETSGA